MTKIPNQIFREFKNLTKIDIQSYSLETVENDTFSGLDTLESISLSSSGVKNIEANAFKGLSCLKKLILIENRLENINMDIFYNLKNLNELCLSYNQFETIEDNTFFALENLRTLSLAKNKIKSLKPKAFNGLNRLKQLDLSKNQLESFEPKLFEMCFNLELLDLGNNVITYIDEGTLPKKLLFLCLRNNEITDLKFLNELTELQYLDLFGKVEYYQNQLMNFENDEIEKLDLTKLKFLSLEREKVPQFDEKFKNLKALEIYDIKDFVKDSFSNLNNLDYLKIKIDNDWLMINFDEDYFNGLRNLKFFVIHLWSSKEDSERLERMKKYFTSLIDQSLNPKEEVIIDGWSITLIYKTCESEMEYFRSVLDISDSIRDRAAIESYLKRISFMD